MLNKNGWGYRSFLVGGAILLIALLFATFFIIRLYHGLPNLSSAIIDPVDYEMIESSISDNALRYVSEYYEQEIKSGVIVISTNNLLKYGFIENKDLRNTENNDECKGYSLIRNDDNKLTSESYIKCKNYQTEGYQDWRVSNE